ncbi:MAG: MEKHLA domain-containing protein, partial [Mariprofundus sp.]
HICVLSDSLKHWTGAGLIDDNVDPVIAAGRIYAAPFALLSHGTEADPVINYANHKAQELFEMDWHAFTKLPSRLSAEEPVRAERDILLKRVTENGYIDDYCGVRISSTGQRFLIEQATVWNLLDDDGGRCGQAAMFGMWRKQA